MRKLLLQIISPAKVQIAGVIALSALVSVLSIIQPALMQKLIDEGILKADRSALMLWLAAMIGFALSSMILSSINRIAYTVVSMKILFLFRERVFGKLFTHTKHFFSRYPSGDLLSRIQGDVNELQQFATDTLFALFSALIGLIGIIVVIQHYSLTLTLAVLLLLPIEFMLLRPFYKPMESSVRSLRENSSSLGQMILEMIRNVGLLQNFGASAMAVEKLHTLHQRQQSLSIRNLKIQLVFSQLPALIALLGRGGILLFGGMQVLNHTMQLGELIAFLTYFGMILGPVQTLLGVLNTYPKAKVSFQRIQEILPDIHTPPLSGHCENGGLIVHALSYRYPQASYTLIDNLNLAVLSGECVAIFGQNGAGKSTLADLLCGLEYPDAGEIYLHSRRIDRLLPGTKPSRIAKLEQHPAILHDTLRKNLTVAKSGATEEELRIIIQSVGLEEWFSRLSEGFETVMGEAGSTISGGERQRLALARMVLLNPEVAIFDEFTSSLDHLSVRTFYELINRLFPSSVRLIISHDPDILDYVDRAYELRNGTLHPMEKNDD